VDGADNLLNMPWVTKLTTSIYCRVLNAWSYTFFPPYIFMACCLIKHRDCFTSKHCPYLFVLSKCCVSRNTISPAYLNMKNNSLIQNMMFLEEKKKGGRYNFYKCVVVFITFTDIKFF
jgi:hypothetical protein